MSLAQRLAAFAAVLTAALLLAVTSAGAAPPRPPAGLPAFPEAVTSAHFVVHYTTAAGSSSAVAPATATTLSGNAEAAYARIVGEWGYPTPLDDGDARTDIYVAFIPGLGPAAGPDDGHAGTTTGYLIVPPASAAALYPVAHELFHLVQMAIDQREDAWLVESSAEWAGQNVIAASGLETPPNWYGSPWTPLDCTGSGCGDGDVGGYRGSIFLEHLDERFGMGFVHEVFDRAAALAAADSQPHSLQALDGALVARGTSLSQAIGDYAIAATAGRIDRPGVTSRRPAVYASLATGGLLGRFQPVSFLVDHLSFKSFLLMGAKPGSSPAVCTPKRLTLDVALPAGVPTQVAFVQGASVAPLAVSGGMAHGEYSWSDCASSEGTVVMPNGGLSADGQRFEVVPTIANVAPPSEPEPAPDPEPAATRLSASARAAARGAVTVRVVTAVAGRLAVKATSRFKGHAFTYATRSSMLRRAGVTTVTLRPGAAARRLLRRAGRLRLSVAVTFTPVQGARRTVRRGVTVREPRG